MLNILFVGRFFSPSLLATISHDSYGKVGFSNHNFELSLLGGLANQKNVSVRALSCPGVYSFPHNNRRLFTKAQMFQFDSIPVRSCGFCNMAIMNRYWKLYSLKNSICQEIETFTNEPVHIIVNTPNYELMLAVRYVKEKKGGRIGSVTVIVPDIPSLITSLDHYNWIKRKIVMRDDSNAMRLAMASDHLVLLTSQMKSLFKKPDSYIVMEGLVDSKDRVFTASEEPQCEIILYTGTLRRQFGVMNLVNAFVDLKDTIKKTQLWICGSGDSSDEIERIAKLDNRIKFFGLVSSSEAAGLQNKATILVNPRTSEGEYTHYSFPSKTLEYLLAGKSTIINKLPGIPEDYYQYVYTPEDESIPSLTAVINDVINTPWNERVAKARRGFSYVCQYKNANYQVSRIIKLLSGDKC